MPKCRLLVLAVAVVAPAAAPAQDFQRYPGLSPTQERILNPIPLPPPALPPSAPVPMIVSPAPIVSAPPPLTIFPGSGAVGSSVDKRERKPPREPLPPIGTAPPEAVQDRDRSKETRWQTVTLPPAPDFTRWGGRSEGPRASGEAAAKSLIEADGYRDVGGLALGADGIWRGKALRGATGVTVSVDARGNVTAE